MPAPSPDHLVAVVCPHDKPHKCPPYGVCYGRYEYCSRASGSAEPCVSETYLDSRKTLCQDIAEGKNITELVRHPSCTMKADCFDEFETLFHPSTQDSDTASPWTYILGIHLGIAAVIIICIVILCAIRYRRKNAKKRKQEKEQQRMRDNNNEAVNIQTNNQINEERLLENGEQRQQPADADPNDGDNDTEAMALLRHSGEGRADALNPPDSGRVTDPPVIDTTMIDIDTGASSGSVSYRNSNHSSENPSASTGSDSPEENRPSTSSNMTHQEEHPAEVEHRRQRAMHMPSSEPSGAAQLVTNQTSYFRANGGRPE